MPIVVDMSARRLGLIAAVLLAIGGLAWALYPEPPPEPPPVAEDDSGMTDAEAEELMRTIGYVQQ